MPHNKSMIRRLFKSGMDYALQHLVRFGARWFAYDDKDRKLGAEWEIGVLGGVQDD